jgi:acetyl-CoA carboxylase biotin carboxyl carrier protein
MSETPPVAFALSTDEPLGGPHVDTAIVRDLAQILKDTDLTTIEVEHGALRIRVAREVTVQAAPVQQYAAPAAAPAAAAPAPAPSAAPSAAPAPAAPEVSGDQVKSPMVGTVYLQPQPGAAAFVKVGDTVAEGQTLVLVEAMKTMNPIPSPRAGKIKALLVGDAQPVEYGEPLVVLE